MSRLARTAAALAVLAAIGQPALADGVEIKYTSLWPLNHYT